MEGNFSNCKGEKRERDELSRGGGNFQWEGSLLSWGRGEFSNPPPRWGDGICIRCCRGWEGFSACDGGGGAGFPASGVLLTDDAPGYSGGTVAHQTTLQVTVGVPVTWEKGKENEMLGLKGTDRFVRFVGLTTGSNGSILVQWLPSPIGWTKSEP